MDLKYKQLKVCISAGSMLDIYRKDEHRSSFVQFKNNKKIL